MISRTFARMSNRVAEMTGSYWVFIGALGMVALWAISGPFFDYSSTWQLAINTGTTILTFLMVFIIQNTENRIGTATQIKLDEIIRAIADADDDLLDTEDATDAELHELKKHYRQLAQRHRALQSQLNEIVMQES